MSRTTDTVVMTGLGFGSLYLNFVATYGAAIVTTLAIGVAAVTLATKVQELVRNWRNRKERDGDVQRKQYERE